MSIELLRSLTPSQLLNLHNDIDLMSRDQWVLQKSYDAERERVHLAEMRTSGGKMLFCLWVEPMSSAALPVSGRGRG